MLLVSGVVRRYLVPRGRGVRLVPNPVRVFVHTEISCPSRVVVAEIPKPRQGRGVSRSSATTPALRCVEEVTEVECGLVERPSMVTVVGTPFQDFR